MSALIRETARARFDAFIAKYTHAFPHYIAARYSSKPKWLVSWLQMAVFALGGAIAIVVTLFQKQKKLYYFEGGRFSDLHALLPPEQVVIIGGMRERRYCRQHGYGFHWDGYIKKLFNIFYYLKIDAAMEILIFLVRHLLGRRLGVKGRLFVYEDTLPIGISLACILKDRSPVTCISHGAMLKANEGVDLLPDGGMCPYNFVYDDYQVSVLQNWGSTCFQMGVTFELPKVSGWAEQIVLIEQSTPDMPEEYDVCLVRMAAFYRQLAQAGYDVIYRARPGVDISTLTDKFDVVHAGDKMTLLGGPLKVFVGYNSSLLYEAQACGHVTIGLDDSTFPFMRAYSPNLCLTELTPECVEAVMTEAFRRLRDEPAATYASLKQRFFSCLDQLENHTQHTHAH